MKNPQVLDRYIFVPEGVYPLNFPLTESVGFRRDQISRETGFIESTVPIDCDGKEGTFFFSPGHSTISYPTLTREGHVLLNNSFSRFGLDLGVRLASDVDIRSVVSQFLQGGQLQEAVVVRREERFLEFPEIQDQPEEFRLTSGQPREYMQHGN